MQPRYLSKANHGQTHMDTAIYVESKNAFGNFHCLLVAVSTQKIEA